jgi:hypothetical protein
VNTISGGREDRNRRGAVVWNEPGSTFKTYENERLALEDVLAIVETAMQDGERNQEYVWRSIKADLEATRPKQE